MRHLCRLFYDSIKKNKNLFCNSYPIHFFEHDTMLNVHSLARTRLNEVPYRWGTSVNLLDASCQRALAEEFPSTGFERMRRRKGSDKRYEAWFRSLKDPGQHNTSTVGLSPQWRRFIECIESIIYRNSLEQCLGVDLKHDLFEVTLWRFGPGHFLDPHTDIAAKRVVHLFYFNEGWNPAWGGCLRILRSRNIEDVVCEIPPDVSQSVILERSECSWHGVSALSKMAPMERKVLQVSFWKEKPRQGKDLPGLETLETC